MILIVLVLLKIVIGSINKIISSSNLNFNKTFLLLTYLLRNEIKYRMKSSKFNST